MQLTFVVTLLKRFELPINSKPGSVAVITLPYFASAGFRNLAQRQEICTVLKIFSNYVLDIKYCNAVLSWNS